MNRCFTCGSQIDENKRFCNKKCYFARVGYRNHSDETKRKIAIGNSKPFTIERRNAISIARTFVPSKELLEKLQHYWRLGYLNPLVIMKLCGLEHHKSLYRRLCNEYCMVPQIKFSSQEWLPEHFEKLIELGNQNVYYRDIADVLGFGEKQVYETARRIGLKLNRRNPYAYTCTSSKPELIVIEWLREAGHAVTQQFASGKFIFDGHIEYTNILIEVHGDYWHCNPKVYKNGAINEMQKASQRRDFAKKAHAAKLGYNLITVWELDIKERSEEIKNWTLKKVEKYKCKMN